MTTEKLHSRIGASSYYRWGVCPGSVKLSANIPKQTSSHAEEGTKAHELAETIIQYSLRGVEVPAILLSEYDEETIEAVKTYTDYVLDLASKASYVGIEEKFELTHLHPDLFGTSDATLVVGDTLHVIDYKHGKGVPVEVVNNKQLQFYGLGALYKSKAKADKIKLTIVQPRCFHSDGPIRSWETDILSLLDFENQLIADAKATEDDGAKIVPGDHCRFCPASAICPALQNMALETAKAEFTPTQSYRPEVLAKALDAIPAIKAWIKSVEEFSYFQAQNGTEIPGYKLVPKRATRKWNNEAEVVSKLTDLIPYLSEEELYEPREVLSPAKVEKLIGKKEKELLKDLYSSISSGTTLVPASDKRQEARPSIETEFTPIIEEGK